MDQGKFWFYSKDSGKLSGVLCKRITWSDFYFQKLFLTIEQRMNYRKSDLEASRSNEERW